MDKEVDAERLAGKGRMDRGRKRQRGDIDVCSVTVAAGRRWRKRVRKWKKAE